jgi:glycosyltransferase involved in cell wall biosynthesis
VKILVLTSTYSRWQGDTEPRFVDNLCHYLTQDNTVHVLAPHAPGSHSEELLEYIQVFRFRYCLERFESLAYGGGILPNLREKPLRFILVPLFLAAQWLAIIRLCRKHHYDIIHAHWIIPQGLSAVLARPFTRGRPPLVLTSHGGDLFALKGVLLSAVKKLVTRGCDALTVVSSAMKDRAVDLQLKKRDQIHTIPMGVDSHGSFLPTTQGTRTCDILFVGRLVDKKGIEYLLQAMPAVVAQQKDAKLKVIGDGPLLAELTALSESLKLTSNVEFAGSVVNWKIADHLRGAAITVFPSVVTDSGDQEGTPVAIMEALACGCATIVSDYPGARDIIVDRETGLLVPQRSPEALSAAILTLLQDPALRQRLGEQGRNRVQTHYDWRVISSRFLDLFESLHQSA